MNDAIRQIESEGYCLLRRVYDGRQVGRAMKLVHEWHERTRNELTDDIPFLNRDHPMIYNLERKELYFLELLFQSSEVHSILMHFLNDRWHRRIPDDEPNYILRSYLARSSNSALPLHIDSFMPYVGSESFIMQVAIILEDQTRANGCTVIVPGSHTSGRYADREKLDLTVPLESRAGDVVIWDSRLWHGTLANTSGGTRWALIATFCRWWIKQAFRMVENVPQSIYERLTANQKAVLGFCSIPYSSEREGIDMKAGYESLKPTVEDYRNLGSSRDRG